jgi:hypothetical protein
VINEFTPHFQYPGIKVLILSHIHRIPGLVLRGQVNQSGIRVNTKLVWRRHNLSSYVELSHTLDHIKGTVLDGAVLCGQFYQKSFIYYALPAMEKKTFLWCSRFPYKLPGLKINSPIEEGHISQFW